MSSIVSGTQLAPPSTRRPLLLIWVCNFNSQRSIQVSLFIHCVIHREIERQGSMTLPRGLHNLEKRTTTWDACECVVVLCTEDRTASPLVTWPFCEMLWLGLWLFDASHSQPEVITLRLFCPGRGFDVSGGQESPELAYGHLAFSHHRCCHSLEEPPHTLKISCGPVK